MDIKGTAHRVRITDFVMACRRCGRIIYFPRYCNGDTVICPHCGERH